MSSKLRVESQKDDTGHLNWLKIYKGKAKKPLRLDFEWDSDGLTSKVDFSGRRQDMPSLADIMLMFNQSFIERIGLVKLINLIEEIELIDRITLIDTITNIGTITEVTEVKDIKTVGADNLFLDLMKQGSVYCRKATLSNNGDTASWLSVTGNDRKAKFFPKGFMGFISTIEVYCRNTVAGDQTITVYISPNPSLGYVASATISVPAFSAADWRTATFNRMWFSDKLFVFVIGSHANVGFAYDVGTAQTQDCFFSSDAGATWVKHLQRMWIKVNMEGLTVGDVNVSGTVNVINIPSVSDERIIWTGDIALNVITTVYTINGAGHTEFLSLCNPAQVSSDTTYILVYTDGNLAFRDKFESLNARGFTPSTPKISLLNFAVDADCNLILSIKFEWKRKLEVKLWNTEGAQANLVVDGLANLVT